MNQLAPVLNAHSSINVDEQPHAFIFNENNLLKYEMASMQTMSLIHQALRSAKQVHSGVCHKELSKQIARVELNQPLNNVEQALNEVKSLYLDHAVYFHHPKYVAHLNCPVAYPAVIAEQLLTAINSSLDTWDQSAGGTLIEQKIIDWSIERIGLSATADGIFTSGGSQSNLMALLLARDHAAERLSGHLIRDFGLGPDAHRYRIFCSEVSHFSIQKSAALLGLGYNAVVPVTVDKEFKMDLTALDTAINECKAQGNIPIALVATAGTTDFGSIDPIDKLKTRCKADNLWLHVDAAYGCGLLAADNHRHLLNGIEQADSVTLDYHKSFLQPVSSSAFIVADKKQFKHLTHHADYLNPFNDNPQAAPNLVDKSIQTTRRFDALKLWLTLRIMGHEQIGKVFSSVMALARSSYVALKQDPEFELIHQPELSTLVFRFNDKNLSDEQLNLLNYQIKDELFKQGECAIARTKFRGINYLKFTLLNPSTQIDDIKSIAADIKACAYSIKARLKVEETSHE